jgi:D-xylose transport system permease protein
LAVAVIACNSYFGVPYILLILGAVVGVLIWFTERTVMGRHIYAIGGNAEAARRSGIPIAQVRIGVFALIGVLAGLGGVLSASRQFAVSIGTGGGTLLLDAIAAAVIGGTSLFGGRGRIYHALIGALVIGSVANGLDLLGEPSSIKNIATGIILVIAVGIDALSRNRRHAQ